MTLTCKYSLLSLKKLATWSVHMPPNLWMHVQLQFEPHHSLFPWARNFNAFVQYWFVAQIQSWFTHAELLVSQLSKNKLVLKHNSRGKTRWVFKCTFIVYQYFPVILSNCFINENFNHFVESNHPWL